jgi:hypothetical protein
MATSIGSHRNVRWKRVLDFLAVAGPIICLIDCVVLPVASALLPFLGMTEFGHGINDQQLFLLIIAICGPIIIPGYLKHRNKRILTMFAVAISMMFVVNFVDLIADETAHAVISLSAACLLIKANRDNKKLLSCACSMHHHGANHQTPAAKASEAFSKLLHVQGEHIHSEACSVEYDHSSPESTVLTARTYAHVHSLHPLSHTSDGEQHLVHDHAVCLHEVVVQLDRQNHGLDPNHFEPRNNLNFEPVAGGEALQAVQASHTANCCG